MAKVRVSAEILAELVFGAAEHEVTVTAGVFDPAQNVFIFDIEGEDVPACEEVCAITSTERRWRGPTAYRMTFHEYLELR